MLGATRATVKCISLSSLCVLVSEGQQATRHPSVSGDSVLPLMSHTYRLGIPSWVSNTNGPTNQVNEPRYLAARQALSITKSQTMRPQPIRTQGNKN